MYFIAFLPLVLLVTTVHIPTETTEKPPGAHLPYDKELHECLESGVHKFYAYSICYVIQQKHYQEKRND